MLKKALLISMGLVVVLLAVFFITAAMQPAEYSVERSTTIDEPTEVVFEQVNDLRNWEDWSPWADIDPDYETTYSGADSGEGAIFEWSGNAEAGSGRMTIEESRPGELVEIKLEFLEPFESTSTTSFTFDGDGEQTEVTWSMEGENDFMMKAFSLFADMDAMIGEDFEKGLDQLESAAGAASAQ